MNFFYSLARNRQFYSMNEHYLLFIISLLANTLSSLAGGGAGLIQLPALLFLGLPFSLALATHKVASVALGLGATLRHLKENRLKTQYVVLILGFGLPGVYVGAISILQIPELIAVKALGFLTLGLGIYSFLKSSLGLAQVEVKLDVSRQLMGGVVLFVLGVLNGSLTSGTGLFVTLWLVSWFGFDYKQAVSYTLILVGIFWNGTGAVTLGFLADIQWSWLPALVLGSFLGGYLGAHLSIVKGNIWVKRSFEIITIVIGFKLILG